MPSAYLKNYRPNTYAEIISAMVELLVSAGWNYLASGSGAGGGVNTSGKLFTTTGSGSTGWANSGAWARVTDPGAVREFIFQHNNSGGIRIKYSAANKFVLGSTLATQTPNATDERYLKGGGPDSTPVYSTTYEAFGGSINQFGSGGTVSYYGAALDTAPYGFWFCGSQVQGTSNTHHVRYACLMMDPVTSVPEDLDPVVISVASGTSSWNATNGPLEGYSVNTGNTGVFARDGNLPGTWAWSNSTAAAPSNQDGTFGHMTTPKTGTVTISIATPGVISWTSHGLTPDCQVIFTNTGGALPTGLSQYVTYYVLTTGFTANSFQVSLARNGTAINTSGSQSGTHTAFGNAFFFVQPAGFAVCQTGTANSTNGIVINGANMATNPFNGNVDSLPMLYMRTNAAANLPGIKGWSTLARWCTTPRVHLLATIDNRTRICVGAVWLPWDGSTLPLG